MIGLFVVDLISFASLFALSESCIIGPVVGRSVSVVFLLDSPGELSPSFHLSVRFLALGSVVPMH